jgi:hypothetical protein
MTLNEQLLYRRWWDRIVAGGGDNVVLDSATDHLFASLANFICSDLSSSVQ